MALEKVLVVDDDPNICDVLMMYLENEGYSVILSYDGEEALVKFNALKPDIVLLDIMLPKIITGPRADSPNTRNRLTTRPRARYSMPKSCTVPCKLPGANSPCHASR